MNETLKLYSNALNRIKRSKGFGIHSPFAYSFVVDTLREKMPYYAYDDIRDRRDDAIRMARENHIDERIISLKNACMLFRIACRFNPRLMLQIGTSFGVSTTSLLDVSSTSRLLIYAGKKAHRAEYNDIIGSHKNRIEEFGTVQEAIGAYRSRLDSAKPFVLVNAVDSESDADCVKEYVIEALNAGGVVIFRNLLKSDSIVTMFNEVNARLDHGMTFSNGRLAVIVGYDYLPRQKFLLWY